MHAGDIGDEAILVALARLAPLTAVRGNNDRGPWADRLPERATVRAGEASIHVVHDLAQLDVDRAGVQVIVSGHSHRPAIERRDGVLFVNPGSAGPRRFKLPVSLARLTVRGREVSAELLGLPV